MPLNTEPVSAVSLPVASGLVMTLLGDTSLANMTALPPSAFNQSDVRLRIWFDGGLGFQQLTPDQRIVSAGYALMANSVPDGSITTVKLGAGVLNPTNFPANSVTSLQLADTVALGATNVTGRLDVYRTSANTPAISLIGNGSQISTFGSDGLEQTRLWGPSYGELLLNNSLANNATAARLSAQGATGGLLELRNTNGSNRAILEGENTGGLLTLYAADGGIGAVLCGNEGQGSGALSLRNTNASPRFRAYGGPTSGALQMFDADGTETVDFTADPNGHLALRQGDGSIGAALTANNGTGGGGVNIYRDDGTFAAQLTIADTTRRDGFLGLARSNSTSLGFVARGAGIDGGGFLGLYQADGTQTVSLQATESGSGGGQMLFRNGAGTAVTLELDGQVGTTGGGYVGVRDASSKEVIVLNGDNGTATAQVIEITGGSDLSEKFEIKGDGQEVKPGTLVCIDPENPGRLVPSRSAYDRTAAGVVSGAGGVMPGMLMGQKGTLADGRHPVALTGRVYARVAWRVSVKVFVDASGDRPAARTDADIQDDYVYYNKLLANYARGCRLSLTEVVQLPASLSSWFNTQARNTANRDALLAAATANKALYAYRDNDINVYVNNSSSGVCCGTGNGLIFTGNENDHITPVHEIGHMLGLAHTQGAGCGGCTDPLGACTSPGDDDIGDTIPDVACWSIDQVSQNWYNLNFDQLSAGQKDVVNDVWLNIMSYHYGSFNNCLERLTPGQMDKVAETSNSSRDNVGINYFRFVDIVNGDDGNDGLTAANSFRTITGAIADSGNDDVLVIRAGTYNKTTSGNWVINANRVLSSRKGTVHLTRQ